MKNAISSVLVVLFLVFFQPNLFAGESNLPGNYYQPLNGFWEGLLISSGAGLIDGVFYSRPPLYPMGAAESDPYRQAYAQRIEQLRRMEMQKWQRYRQEQGRMDADRDFYQNQRR
jgi:hypothetical protein